VDYDPAGKTIACGTFDSIIIVDAQTGEPIGTLPIPNLSWPNNPIRHAARRHDGLSCDCR